MAFLTHFQLLVRYETSIELPTSLWQSTSTHILDHIHEWIRRWRLIESTIPNQLLVDWFTKSLLPLIARDVAMGGDVTKEQAINRAQYLDLVYSQSGTLYDLIPQAPRPTDDPSKPPQAHSNGIIFSIQEITSSGQTSMPNSTTKTSDVNVVQATQSKNPPTKKINNRKKNLL